METRNQEPLKIEDILNYSPDTYFSDDEITSIQTVFGGAVGEKNLKILRKVFLPTISDPELPREEMGNDIWLSKMDFESMPAEHAKEMMIGRQNGIKIVIGGLVRLKVLANDKSNVKSPEEIAALNSAK